MAFPGNKMMANGILRALGLDTKELAKAENVWLDLPNTSSLKFEAKFTLAKCSTWKKQRPLAAPQR